MNFFCLTKLVKNNSGQALIAVAVFLALGLGLSLSLTNYVIQSNRYSTTLNESEAARYLAEAGIEKAIFCLNETSGANCGGTYGINYTGENNVALGDGSFTTVISGTGTTRTVTSTGKINNTAKKIKAAAGASPETEGISFSYALQIGQGGITLENNATVNGSVYSNGDIECNSRTSSLISGDATAAGSTSEIDNCRIGYDATAHKIENSSIGQNAYYQTIDSQTTVTGTKYPNSPDPGPIPLPTINLAEFEQAAAGGGIITGDYTPASGTNLGPKKITGNLHLNNNAILNVTGVIWVLGNITIDQGAELRLDPAFGDNSTLLIADNVTDLVNYGKINVSNGVIITGASSKSHLVLYSTNSSMNLTSPAIDLNNTAQAGVFMAPYGLIRLKNNANVKAVVGYSVHVDQNGIVSYKESDLININLAAGQGGAFKYKKGTWQEVF